MAHQESLVERAIDKFKPQPGPPAKPKAPAVPDKEWQGSVERKEVVPGLTVHDIGLSIFGETRSLHDGPNANEPIAAARQKIAHAIINGAELAQRTGKKQPSVHAPLKPSDKTLLNRDEMSALESSMRAAREAYLSGHDPTNNATHFNMRTTPSRSDWNSDHRISTQSGPYYNSFPNQKVPSHRVWLNTYLPDDDDTKPRRNR